MTRSVASSLALAVMLLATAGARAEMPGIRTTDANQVAECATPGRLMAYLKSRNEKLDPRFDKIAVEYMRHGEQLGLRWDYTFFQMLLETGHLSFRGDRGRRGDVKSSQNNFAGLGATGHGASGESFPDVSTGVLAHLQHVLVYAGESVENPVAERTRKVQEWGILKSMQKRAKGAVTFAHLATKWAPGADYVAGIEALAGRFRESYCDIADPHPELVAEARGKLPVAVATEAAPANEKISGAELARRAIAEGKEDGDDRRKGLGAGALASAAKAAASPSPPYSILNTSPPETEAGSTGTSDRAKGSKPQAGSEKGTITTASAAGAMLQSPAGNAPMAKVKPEAAEAGGKCRVWTASYGGQKALIIRVKAGDGFDYTVLDVNEGAERREAEAYIAAYAKGGAVEAEFASQTQALEKAFELCPER